MLTGEHVQDKTLNLAWLYPEYLNLYGDRGNVIALVQRAAWRGVQVTVQEISIGDPLVWQAYDLMFIGGGQDAEQAGLYRDLLDDKQAAIKQYIEDGRVLLAICGGYQLLGEYYRNADGKEIKGIGALPLYTEAQQERLIGDLQFAAEKLPLTAADSLMYGFENHSGLTYLRDPALTFGKVVSGHGNNGQDRTEGCHYKNSFGTYCHGSFLPKNPAFADYLLEVALRKKYNLPTAWHLEALSEPLLATLRNDLACLHKN